MLTFAVQDSRYLRPIFRILVTFTVLFLLASLTLADSDPEMAKSVETQEQSSTRQGRVTIAGKTIAYTSTVGDLILQEAGVGEEERRVEAVDQQAGEQPAECGDDG